MSRPSTIDGTLDRVVRLLELSDEAGAIEQLGVALFLGELLPISKERRERILLLSQMVFIREPKALALLSRAEALHAAAGLDA